MHLTNGIGIRVLFAVIEMKTKRERLLLAPTHNARILQPFSRPIKVYVLYIFTLPIVNTVGNDKCINRLYTVYLKNTLFTSL